MFRRRSLQLCVAAIMATSPAILQGASAWSPAQQNQTPPLESRDPSSKPPVSEKQKSIDADTQKLVQMAAELKVSVDKSNKNELSIDVVRRAEAIERLAKSLKERLRDAR